MARHLPVVFAAFSVVAALGSATLAETQCRPDLVVLQSYMSGWTVAPKTGGGYEIRFSTGFANQGTGPLHLFAGDSYPDLTRDVWQTFDQCGTPTNRLVGRFVHHPGHSHFHIERFARYRLRKRTPGNGLGSVVAQNDYTTFCLNDINHYNSSLPGSPLSSVYNTCSAMQGLSVGWNDVNGSSLSGQSIDLACVVNGDYWLEQEVDPDNAILELNETNNVTRIPLTISTLPPLSSVPYCPDPAGTATLVSPESLVVGTSVPSDSIRARIWYSGITEAAAPSLDITAEVGYGPDGTHPENNGSWTWYGAGYRGALGADDVYIGSLIVSESGVYDYAFRFRYGMTPWIYADRDGTLNGYSTSRAGSMRVEATLDVGDPPRHAFALRLLNHPSRSTATLSLTLPADDVVDVSVFDLTGRRIRTLFRGAAPAGTRTLVWDGSDADGGRVPTGIYLARARTESGHVASMRVALLR